MGIGLFSHVTGNRKRKLCQEKFELDKRRNFFPERVAKHWNRLHRAEVEIPTRGVDVALAVLD